MLGLILAIIVGSLKISTGRHFPSAYLSATHFLFWWYVAMAGLALLVVALVAFGIVNLSAGIVRFAFGRAVVKFIGGMLGMLAAIMIIGGNALRIIAAWLLAHAVKHVWGVYTWNYFFLGLGALLLIIALSVRSRK